MINYTTCSVSIKKHLGGANVKEFYLLLYSITLRTISPSPHKVCGLNKADASEYVIKAVRLQVDEVEGDR